MQWSQLSQVDMDWLKIKLILKNSHQFVTCESKLGEKEWIWWWHAVNICF